MPSSHSVDERALTVVRWSADTRARTRRARDLLAGPSPVPAARRRRAGELLGAATESLGEVLEDPSLSPAVARRLAELRERVDVHLLAAGDPDDATLAVHHGRLLRRAAHLLSASADAFATDPAGRVAI